MSKALVFSNLVVFGPASAGYVVVSTRRPPGWRSRKRRASSRSSRHPDHLRNETRRSTRSAEASSRLISELTVWSRGPLMRRWEQASGIEGRSGAIRRTNCDGASDAPVFIAVGVGLSALRLRCAVRALRSGRCVGSGARSQGVMSDPPPRRWKMLRFRLRFQLRPAERGRGWRLRRASLRRGSLQAPFLAGGLSALRRGLGGEQSNYEL